jgi:uncharacterized protein (TIGR00255 family)
MVHSMTGFATATITLTTPTTSVPAVMSLKTLNSRFIDVNCKFPPALSYLETAIIKKCKQSLHRGSIYITLHISSTNALKTSVQPSYRLAESYLEAIKSVQTKFDLPGTITISDFMRLPDLLEAVEEGDVSNNEAIIMDAIDSLLINVTAARQREGVSLEKDLTERMHVIQESMTTIEPRAAEMNEQRKEHFLREIKASLESASPEVREQHLQALYNNIENIDVHEEIVRFKNHHKNFLLTLNDATDQKGKKLDFILQEMFREINTLSAKLPDTISGLPIITIKVELEKAREQVQNVV